MTNPVHHDSLEGNMTFHDMGILATVTPKDPIKKSMAVSNSEECEVYHKDQLDLLPTTNNDR
jgi:hypothetical protein